MTPDLMSKYLEFLRQIHKDFLEMLMEGHDKEDGLPLFKSYSKDMPDMISYEEDDIDLLDKSFASGKVLGMPKSTVVKHNKELM